jgi:response regulator RpfG family c-di-GMP phosphodiesterase
MMRPCFLVVDRESSSSISTRKLIIETAKFNVITAYSSAEAVQTLAKFPAIDGVVADAGVDKMECSEMVTELKKISSTIPVIIICTPRGKPCENADHTLESFDPRLLLALLQRLQPEAVASIERRNEELEDEHFKR